MHIFLVYENRLGRVGTCESVNRSAWLQRQRPGDIWICSGEADVQTDRGLLRAEAYPTALIHVFCRSRALPLTI